jgi:dienelactone hydrolase
MKKLLITTAAAFSQDITGRWNGLLEVRGSKISLVFNISKTDAGYSATMDSPDQGAKDIPVGKISFENSKNLTLEIPMAQITYTATLDPSNEFIGNFNQAGNSFPMNLSRVIKKINRPQEPKAPFPYYSENVTFENKKENFMLAGTLTLPEKDGRFPVVVLISGSGAQNRDSELLGHKPFWVIADYLTKNGVGVLRFDDRGVAESKGSRANATSKDFADDVLSAVNYLKSRKDIDPKKIGLIGHSEGGTIAPMVAANSKDIAYMVLLAGTGIRGDELLKQQSYLLGKASGMNETQLEEAAKFNSEIYSIIKSGKDREIIKTELATVFERQFNSLPEPQKPPAGQIQSIIAQQTNELSSPWLQFFINYDPRLVLKDVHCPVLILNGENDLQVPALANTEAIKTALEQSGNRKVSVTIFPKLNHLFQESETGAFEEYEKIEQTFSPVALQAISDWISLQVKLRTKP